ncbi:MAG TPA: hypothetical protein VFU00_08240 [Gemmatimonadales bacterium]|nr:hypothetical protein [Gemmatimonadales bacterium]
MELGSSQISSLMETLPGIAQVLRSPVADAMVHLSRAAARIEEFRVADTEELLRYAVRRSLLGHDEAEQVIAEVQAAQQKRIERAADRAADRSARAKPRPKPKPAAKPKPKALRKPAKPKPSRPVKSAPRKAARAKKR